MDIVKFAQSLGLIKRIKRSGWLRYLPADRVESVADHSCRMGLLTLALRNQPNVDYRKCMQFAIIHDLAEGITGDFTPHDKITSEQKRKLEDHAMERIFSSLPVDSREYYGKLWEAYESQQVIESKLVRDLDKYEMMQQAYEYEQLYKVDLSEFFESFAMLKTDIVKEWAKELIEKRNKQRKQ